ncbi:MAG: hypothetical protein ACTSW1_01505 [Candidatus Hodarchaeales archaeon]
MVFPLIKKRHRGQMRAVDFVVSLFLFLLMLSQIILIIVNIQTGINRNSQEIITYEEFDTFSRLILQEKGTPFWGYEKNLPQDFGLASYSTTSYLTLDPSKISRLVSGTPFSVTSVTGFELFDYPTLKSKFKLPAKKEFQIGFYSSLYVDTKVKPLSDPFNLTHNTLEIKVLSQRNLAPISNVKCSIFIIDLRDASILQLGDVYTNSTGQYSLDYEIPGINDPSSRHFALIIAEKGATWGLNWAYEQTVDTPRIYVGQNSNITVWSGGINSSALLSSDIVPAIDTPLEHYQTLIYQNSLGSYSTRIHDLGIQLEGNETFLITNEGLVISISIVKFTNQYRVGITSYPAILDNTGEQGLFFNIMGDNPNSNQVKTLFSKTYPIIVRGLLMYSQITMWSE